MPTELILRKRVKYASIAEKLLAMSIPEPNSGCWLWLGTTSWGYGYLRVHGRMQIASRTSYRTFIGEPGDLHVCHTCDNTYCINPEHLFLGNAAINADDSARKDRRGKRLNLIIAGEIKRATGSQQAIADAFSVSQTLVSAIRRDKIWRHA